MNYETKQLIKEIIESGLMNEAYTENDKGLNKINRTHEKILYNDIKNISAAIDRQAMQQVKQIEKVFKNMPEFIQASYDRINIHVHLDNFNRPTVRTKYNIYMWFSSYINDVDIEADMTMASTLSFQSLSSFIRNTNVTGYEGRVPSNAVGYISATIQSE